ncbi:cysteine hydrolase family protein [Pseudomonas sp. KNUC1026]|uniref:cysteine hydrolase family protein n=1 Tax=Pseudomonas sp. KNUC1026 TaxID=2893890 RepID=UPI001F2AD62D|nr:cysteine hydrolase family protein [Pseudomonas sp. KNUC1026]UFH50770.1 cysteine hydrolase [Pseudomonas sp. KNUC1026]
MHALLILDFQVGLFHGPHAPWQGAALLDRINRLLAKAHAAEVPVLLARHVGPAGSPLDPAGTLTQLLPELALRGDEWVFEKQRPNAFHATALLEHLQGLGASQLLVAGMKTQVCVDSTCRAARDLGVEVLLVADAHGCCDTPELPAERIIAHHNATLGTAFCGLVTADAWCPEGPDIR